MEVDIQELDERLRFLTGCSGTYEDRIAGGHMPQCQLLRPKDRPVFDALVNTSHQLGLGALARLYLHRQALPAIVKKNVQAVTAAQQLLVLTRLKQTVID